MAERLTACYFCLRHAEKQRGLNSNVCLKLKTSKFLYISSSIYRILRFSWSFIFLDVHLNDVNVVVARSLFLLVGF